MKNVKLIIIGLLAVCSFQANAQFGYYQDALRFSQTNWLVGSSARMQGIGGAQTSLGGDISLVGTNPAGLGFYNRGAASISLGLDFQNSDDEYVGLVNSNFSNVFGIRNAGVVMNFNKGRFTEDKFKGGSLGISFAKINDFNRDYRYEGAHGTSIVDFFLDQAYLFGIQDGSFAEAAYNQLLIDFDDTSNPNDYIEFVDGNDVIISPTSDVNNLDGFTSPFGAGFSEPYQEEVIQQRGGQHQINISWGGNYSDKLYFGAGLGIQTLYYRRTREFTESDFLLPGGTSDLWINSIRFSDRLISRGAGVNMSFGAIVRPVNVLTLGITYQTPTFLTINEESDFSLATNWNDYLYYDSLGGQGYFELDNLERYLPPFVTETRYRVKTPSRLNVGGTFFLGKLGFLTADAEFVDYANAELQSQDFSPLGENQEILNFKSVINYRLGSEFRLDQVRLRAGYGVMQDPTGNGNDRQNITFGIGYRVRDYFIDLAVVNTRVEATYRPYTFGFFDLPDPVVNSEISNTTVTLTTGFTF